ncbi:MAG: ParA family protein [Hyphomicrobiaceae bacterium]
MAARLAVANLKGGVGKSTTTMFLAETLALCHGVRVLVVDLDPQSSTSFMLLSSEGMDVAESMGRLLPKFLLDVEGKGPKPELHSYIVGEASDLEELRGRCVRGRVDVLPSVPRLWFVETVIEKRSYIQNVDPGAELRLTLGQYLHPLDAFYDLIIFDCPPGFSGLTRAGLLGADMVLSPTIADAVSMRSLTDFVEIGLGEVLQKKDIPHFVVISKYQQRTTDPAEINRLRRRYDVLEPPIGFSIQMTKATQRLRHNSFRTYRAKYGRLEADIRALTDQFYRYALAKGAANE